MSSRGSSPSPSEQPPASRWSNVLVGYDGSDSACRALERIAEFAGEKAQVVVDAVMEPYPGSGVTIPVNESEAEVRRRQNDLVEAQSLLESRGVHASIKSFVLGSVSSRIVSGAPCDVLVVR